MRSTRVSVLVFALALQVATRVSLSQGTLDQANDPAWTGGAVNIIPANNVSQTFVPSRPYLLGVEVALQTGNPGQGGDTVTLAILGDNGQELASVDAEVPEGFDGYWRFDFGGGVHVTPGRAVTLRLRDSGRIVFFLKYEGGNPYPAGQMYFFGSPFAANDCLFRTYGSQSPGVIQFTDADWHSMGGLAGVNAEVGAIAVANDGKVYVGGGWGFTAAGGVVVSGIALWTGRGWTNLGAGVGGSVSALALGPTGQLYAAGNFTTAGGAPANHVAMWDGARWSNLGNGLRDTAGVLAVDSAGNLYAGGYSMMADGCIAKWNGSSWTNLQAGLQNSTLNARVDAFATDSSGNVYVGGYFDTAGATPARNIAKWDGLSWASLGAGLDLPGYSLAVDPSGLLYAAGFPAVMRWDGNAWTQAALGSPPGDGIRMLTFRPTGAVYAVAQEALKDFVAKWDGNVWTPLGTNSDGIIRGFGVDGAGDVYIGGQFTRVGTVAASHVAQWPAPAQAWLPMGSGLSGTTADSALPRTTVLAMVADPLGNLYVGGDFAAAGGVALHGIAKWDRHTWSALGSGLGGYWPVVYDLALDPAGALYAAGDFTMVGGVTAAGIAKWDGHSWASLGSGIEGHDKVHAVAVDRNGNLYAGGAFTVAGGCAANRIAMWNGNAWTNLGSGMDGDVLVLMSDPSGILYAGGTFTHAGGLAANRIAQWNGVAWTNMGSGMNQYVSALAADGQGGVYAGGWFTRAGAANADYVARWDGHTWTNVGLWTGMPPVSALAVDRRGNLYAGCDYGSTLSIARWDGREWSRLGSGVNAAVEALSVDRWGNLYVGGAFTVAGGKVSAYCAYAQLEACQDLCGYADAGAGWREVPWFGWANCTFDPWLLHLEHGWLYKVGQCPDSLYLYSLDMGWLWTSESVYPYLYRFQPSAWLYYLRDTASPRWFYNVVGAAWEPH